MKSSESAQPINVYKVEIAPGKFAYLREIKIADTRLAAKMVGKKGSNAVEMNILLQEELLKLLLIQIDDKKLDHTDKNNLDKLFSFAEYKRIMGAIQKIAGDENEGEEVQMEFETL